MDEKNLITCAVVKDLMPSYVDGICSEDSKKLVTKHVQNCRQCQQMLDMLKNTMLTAEKTGTEQVNYMKKVKQRYKNKSMAGFRLFALLVGLVMFYILYDWYNIDEKMFYIFQTVMIVGAYFMLPNYMENKIAKNLSNIFGIISIVMILGVVFLLWQSYRWIMTESGPFGMELAQVGPFLVKLLLLDFGVQFVILASSMILPFWNIHVKKMPAIFSIMGCCIALIFIYLLRNMSVPERYVWSIIKHFVLLVIDGGIVTAAVIYGSKFLIQNNKHV